MGRIVYTSDYLITVNRGAPRLGPKPFNIKTTHHPTPVCDRDRVPYSLLSVSGDIKAKLSQARSIIVVAQTPL